MYNVLPSVKLVIVTISVMNVLLFLTEELLLGVNALKVIIMMELIVPYVLTLQLFVHQPQYFKHVKMVSLLMEQLVPNVHILVKRV